MCVSMSSLVAFCSEICLSLGVDSPSEVLFLTDLIAEAEAAKLANVRTVLSVRPGNDPLPAVSAVPPKEGVGGGLHCFRGVARFALLMLCCRIKWTWVVVSSHAPLAVAIAIAIAKSSAPLCPARAHPAIPTTSPQLTSPHRT